MIQYLEISKFVDGEMQHQTSFHPHRMNRAFAFTKSTKHTYGTHKTVEEVALVDIIKLYHRISDP